MPDLPSIGYVNEPDPAENSVRLQALQEAASRPSARAPRPWRGRSAR